MSKKLPLSPLGFKRLDSQDSNLCAISFPNFLNPSEIEIDRSLQLDDPHDIKFELDEMQALWEEMKEQKKPLKAPPVKRSKKIKRKKIKLKRASPFDFFKPRSKVLKTVPVPKPKNELTETLLADNPEAWTKIFRVHGGVSRKGILRSFSMFKTIEYEMPMEGE